MPGTVPMHLPVQLGPATCYDPEENVDHNLCLLQVRSMAAAILKTVAQWMEGRITNESQPEAMAAVREALEAILLDGSPVKRTGGPAGGPLREGSMGPEDSIQGAAHPLNPGLRRMRWRGSECSGGNQVPIKGTGRLVKGSAQSCDRPTQKFRSALNSRFRN